MVSREQDRLVFRELFDAYFRDPEMANKLLAQMLPSAEGKAEPSKRRPRVREALAPQQRYGQQAKPAQDRREGRVRRRHDGQRPAAPASTPTSTRSSATEYRLVERLARDIALPVPHVAVAPHCARAARGARLHWPGVHAPGGAHRRRAAAAAAAAAARAAAAAAGAGRRVGLDGALCAPAAGLFACGHPAPPRGATCLPSAPT